MELQNDLLAEALQIAAVAHQFTVDKQGHPYVLHPIRVMLQFTDEPAQVVALLHDVVEDSGIDLGFMQEQGGYTFSPEMLSAIESITKRPTETLEAYWTRVKANPLALRVKLADIKDNTDRLSSLYAVNPQAAVRLYEKYDRALRFLTTETIVVPTWALQLPPDLRLDDDQDG